jgi:hypothetical protein
MPEPSPRDREKLAQLDAPFASTRLVEALEKGWEITFSCHYCGTSKTWRRDTFLGRARKLLGATMVEIQRKVVCPRCPGHIPIMTFSGVLDLGAGADQARHAMISTLLDAGLNPSDYGYGYQRPGR